MCVSRLLAGKSASVPPVRRVLVQTMPEGGGQSETYWPDTGSLFLQGKMTELEVFTQLEKQKVRSKGDACEANFVFSALCRARCDVTGEIKYLQAALETKAFTNQCYSMATIRAGELSLVKK